jgi:MraZ protein
LKISLAIGEEPVPQFVVAKKWPESGPEVADETAQGVPPTEYPRGMYPARLDDKGRLKLPAEFQRFLGGLPEKRLFVTSLDRRIATIYPIAVWKENEKFFENYTDDPATAENVAFTAADLGSEAEMDAQGRIQFSTQLRRDLNLEDQTVRLQAYKGSVQVLSEAIYQARRAQSSKSPEADLKLLQRAGLK